MIYFPYTTPEKLGQVRQAMAEKEKTRLALEAITVDLVHAGEQQPESDHQFKGERTESGLFREQHFRNAKGWFSYELRNPGGLAKKLRITLSWP